MKRLLSLLVAWVICTAPTFAFGYSPAPGTSGGGASTSTAVVTPGDYTLSSSDAPIQVCDIRTGDVNLTLPDPATVIGKPLTYCVSAAVDANGSSTLLDLTDYDTARDTPDHSLLFCTGWVDSDYAAGRIVKIDAITGAQIGSLDFPEGSDDPYGLDVSDDGSLLLVADDDSNTVFVVNGVNMTIINAFDFSEDCPGSYDVALSPDGTKGYLSNQDDKVIEFNVADGTVTNAYELAVNWLAVSDDGLCLFAAAGDTVIKVDVSDGSTVATSGEYSSIIGLRKVAGEVVINANGDHVVAWLHQSDLTERTNVSAYIDRTARDCSVSTEDYYGLPSSHYLLSEVSNTVPGFRVQVIIDSLHTYNNAGCFYNPTTDCLATFMVDQGETHLDTLKRYRNIDSPLRKLNLGLPLGSKIKGVDTPLYLNQTGASVTLTADADGYRIVSINKGPITSLAYGVPDIGVDYSIIAPVATDYPNGTTLTYNKLAGGNNVTLAAPDVSPVIHNQLDTFTFVNGRTDGAGSVPTWVIQSMYQD